MRPAALPSRRSRPCQVRAVGGRPSGAANTVTGCKVLLLATTTLLPRANATSPAALLAASGASPRVLAPSVPERRSRDSTLPVPTRNSFVPETSERGFGAARQAPRYDRAVQHPAGE